MFWVWGWFIHNTRPVLSPAIICLLYQKVFWDDEFRDGRRLLRNVGKLNFPSPSNEVSGLGCGWASPALGRKEAGRKERAGILSEMHGH